MTIASEIAREFPELVLADERPCTAEAAECTCPEFCERDHDTD